MVDYKTKNEKNLLDEELGFVDGVLEKMLH